MEQSLEKNLRREAAAFNPSDYSSSAGKTGWTSPSNIAIIKYWGKREVQLPMNPSLSLTLREAVSRTTLNYEFAPERDSTELQFRFEGASTPAFASRIEQYMDRLLPYLPALRHCSLEIESENTFPHSSGIASSASAMSALALCLISMEQQVRGIRDDGQMFMKASFLARLGSGSASRSLFPGFALWGSDRSWKGSSDEFAIPVTEYHPEFGRLRDAILVVEPGQKKVSSSAGHSLMETNPFSKARFRQARQNLGQLGIALKTGDWGRFIEIMEEEALTLHAMMMTGRPGYLLMEPATLSVIQRTWEFRKSSGCRVGFTLDAGANVHLLYAEADAGRVETFIHQSLTALYEGRRVISDGMGEGPQPFDRSKDPPGQ
mgnify:CR=1 FL=1